MLWDLGLEIVVVTFKMSTGLFVYLFVCLGGVLRSGRIDP